MDWAKELDRYEEEQRRRAASAPVAPKTIGGHVKEIGSDIIGGAYDVGDMALRAARGLPGGPAAGDEKSSLGAVIGGMERFKEKTPILQDKPHEGYLAKSVHGGIRSAVTSIIAGAPGAAAGAVIGSAIPVIGTFLGAVVGYAAGGAGMFGLAEYDRAIQETNDKVASGEITKAQAERSALIRSVAEGGFEFAADLLEGATLGAGRVLTRGAKQALKESVAGLFKNSMKDTAMRMGKIAAIETGSEMLTGGVQTEASRDVGLTNQRFWDGALEAMGPAFVASLIFGGIGEVGLHFDRKDTQKKLADETTDPVDRIKAAQIVHNELRKVSPDLATQWQRAAILAINNNLPIDLSKDIENTEPGEVDLITSGLASGRMTVDDLRKRRSELDNDDPMAQWLDTLIPNEAVSAIDRGRNAFFGGGEAVAGLEDFPTGAVNKREEEGIVAGALTGGVGAEKTEHEGIAAAAMIGGEILPTSARNVPETKTVPVKKDVEETKRESLMTFKEFLATKGIDPPSLMDARVIKRLYGEYKTYQKTGEIPKSTAEPVTLVKTEEDKTIHFKGDISPQNEGEKATPLTTPEKAIVEPVEASDISKDINKIPEAEKKAVTVTPTAKKVVEKPKKVVETPVAETETAISGDFSSVREEAIKKDISVDFIENKVRQLKSVKNVEALYPDDTGVGKYARAYAKSIYETPSAEGASGAVEKAVPAIRKDKKGNILQPVDDVQQNMEMAKEARGDFELLITDLAKQVGGEVAPYRFEDKDGKVPTPLKNINRILEKLDKEKGGKAETNLDYLGSMISVANWEAAKTAADHVGKHESAVRQKDRVAKPLDTGYRDYLINVVLPNGHVAEVQVAPKAMVEAKNNAGHHLYDHIRTLREDKKWLKKLGAKDRKVVTGYVDHLIMLSEELYDKANELSKGDYSEDVARSLAASSEEILGKFVQMWRNSAKSISSLVPESSLKALQFTVSKVTSSPSTSKKASGSAKIEALKGKPPAKVENSITPAEKKGKKKQQEKPVKAAVEKPKELSKNGKLAIQAIDNAEKRGELKGANERKAVQFLQKYLDRVDPKELMGNVLPYLRGKLDVAPEKKDVKAIKEGIRRRAAEREVDALLNEGVPTAEELEEVDDILGIEPIDLVVRRGALPLEDEFYGLDSPNETYDKTESPAFEPSQIKSAIGNVGTFDANNPSILRETKESYDSAEEFTDDLLSRYNKIKETMLSHGVDPEAKNKISRATITKVFEAVDPKMLSALAKAGQAAKGWVAKDVKFIRDFFGEDANDFAAVVAILSPQTAVGLNMKYALRVWRDYLRAGRPKDAQQVTDLVEAIRKEDSYKRISETKSKDIGLFLTGQKEKIGGDSALKIQNWHNALMGDPDAVTIDVWMAMAMGADWMTFKKTKNSQTGKMEFSYGPAFTDFGYRAYMARAREAAKEMGWDAVETQETIWSLVGALYNKMTVGKSGGFKMGFKDALNELTNEDVVNRTNYGGELFLSHQKNELGAKDFREIMRLYGRENWYDDAIKALERNKKKGLKGGKNKVIESMSAEEMKYIYDMGASLEAIIKHRTALAASVKGEGYISISVEATSDDTQNQALNVRERFHNRIFNEVGLEKLAVQFGLPVAQIVHGTGSWKDGGIFNNPSTGFEIRIPTETKTGDKAMNYHTLIQRVHDYAAALGGILGQWGVGVNIPIAPAYLKDEDLRNAEGKSAKTFAVNVTDGPALSANETAELSKFLEDRLTHNSKVDVGWWIVPRADGVCVMAAPGTSTKEAEEIHRWVKYYLDNRVKNNYNLRLNDAITYYANSLNLEDENAGYEGLGMEQPPYGRPDIQSLRKFSERAVRIIEEETGLLGGRKQGVLGGEWFGPKYAHLGTTKALKKEDIQDILTYNREDSVKTFTGRKLAKTISSAFAGIKTTVKGLAFNYKFLKEKHAIIKDTQLRDVNDLVALAQLVRDPRIEHLRVICVKDGKIAHVQEVSSRMPDFVTFGSEQNLEKLVDSVAAAVPGMDPANGDGVYILHNHPTGDPTPSDMDVRATVAIKNRLGKLFREHVVINSGKYAIVKPDPTLNTGAMVYDIPGHVEKILVPSIHNDLLGRRIDATDILNVAQDLKVPENYVTLLYMGANLRVRAVEDVPVQAFIDKGTHELNEFMRNRARMFGAGQGAIAFCDENAIFNDNRFGGAMRGLVSDRSLIDVVMPDKSTVRHKVPLKPDHAFGVRVSEYPAFLAEPKEKFDTDDIFTSNDTGMREKILQGINKMDDWRTALFDRFHPIKQVLGEEKAYILQRGTTGAPETISAFLHHTLLDVDKNGAFMPLEKDGKVTRGEGFLPWLQKVKPDARNFFKWLAAKRAEELDKQGREKWITPEKRAAIYKEVGNPKTPGYTWEKMNDEFQQFNKNILDIAEKSGLIDPEARKTWEQHFYLPFYRIFEDPISRETLLRGPKNQAQFISAGIRQLKGANAQIGDPFENILRNWSHMIKESMMNVARAQIYADLTSDKVKVLSKVIDHNGNLLPLVQEHKGQIRFGDAVLSFRKDGKPINFRVNDAELFNAISNVNLPVVDNFIMKMFSGAKHWLTFGATFAPTFRIANMIRDTLHTAIISRSFKPFLDTARGFVKAFRESEDFIKLQASGFSFGASYVRAEDPKALGRYLDKIVAKEGKGGKHRILTGNRLVRFTHDLLAYWEKIGSASENAARVQLYSNLLSKGEEHLKAAFAAKDLLDFSMRGSAKSIALITSVIPFLNARMQGLYKMGRSAVQDPTGFAIKGGLLALASMALWAFNQDKDEWDELEEWEKRNYYHIWVDDLHVRIPKPFETGAIFSTMFEAAADAAKNEDFGYFARTLGNVLMENLAMNPIPQLALPAVEQYFNKSVFTGRPIVNYGMERLLPKEQYEPWTSLTARLAGEMGISPIRAQKLIEGYFSTFGAFMLGISDSIVRVFGEDPGLPSKQLGDYPVLGRFVKKGEPRHTQYINEFYDAMKEMDQLNATLKHYLATGDYEKAVNLERSRVKELTLRPAFNKARTQLMNINRAIREAYRSNMTPDEKRTRIDALTKTKNDLTKQMYEAYK